MDESLIGATEPNQFLLPIMLAFSNKTNISSITVYTDGIQLQSMAPHI